MAVADSTNVKSVCTQLISRTDQFKALADPARIDLLLRIATVEEISCTDIVREANVTASTVSYHVKVLKAAGFVTVRKEGRNYHYSANSVALTDLADLLAALGTCTAAHVVV